MGLEMSAKKEKNHKEYKKPVIKVSDFKTEILFRHQVTQDQLLEMEMLAYIFE